MGGKSISSSKSFGRLGVSLDLNKVLANPINQKYMEAVKSNNADAAEDIVQDLGFEKLPDGRLVGYKVAQYKDGKAISDTDSKQSNDLTPGAKIKYSGNGTLVTPYPKYAIDNYAVHDNNVIQKVAFKKSDVTSDNKNDKKPELSIKSGEILDSEVFTSERTPVRLNKIPGIVRDNNNQVIPLHQRFENFAPMTSNKMASSAQKTSKPTLNAAPTSNTPPPTTLQAAPSSGGGNNPPPATPPSSGGNQPPKKFPNSDSPISETVSGNIAAPTFIKNAQDRGLTPEQWAEKLADVEEKMFEMDPNDGHLTMTDDEFNREIGDMVEQNLKDRKAQIQEGQLSTLPKTGKMVTIGDIHGTGQNIAHILEQIQSNPETNLDNNPDVKIMFLGDLVGANKYDNEHNKKLLSNTNGASGEVNNRLISLLMAKYPNQIFSIMGNHDIGLLIGEKYLNDPTYKIPDFSTQDIKDVDNDPNLSDAEKTEKKELLKNYQFARGSIISAASDTPGTAGAPSSSNTSHTVEKMKQTPIATIVGDKNKGEKVSLFTHTPWDKDTIDINTLKQVDYDDFANNPSSSKALQYLFGKGASDEKEVEKVLDRLGIDDIYFGHLPPDKGTLLKSPRLHFIDSETAGKNSSYQVVDFDNDSSTRFEMPDVIAASPNAPSVKKVKHMQENAKNISPGTMHILVEDMMR